MKTKDWLSAGVGVVTYLFGAFSNFLGGIAAPPLHPLHDSSTKLAVGLASFASLMVFLIVVAAMRALGNVSRVVPLVLSLLCLAGFVVGSARYKADREALSFDYAGEDYCGGYVFTPFADAVIRRDPAITKTMLVRNAGGVRAAGSIWPPASIDAAHSHLSLLYIAFVVAAVAATFWLTEGVLSEGSAG
jgi:hypothetical protein